MTIAIAQPPPDTAGDLLADLDVKEHEDLAGGYASAILDRTGTYRYLLTRIWDRERPVACWVMLNPSTADAAKSDNTLRRVVDFTAGFGCGGLAIVNLFALRSRHPEKLTRHHNPAGPLNDSFVQRAIRSTNGGPVIAAWGSWGNRPQLRARTAHVRGLLRDARVPVSCLGQSVDTSGRQPLHPLMLHGATPLRPYDLENDPT